MKRALCGLSLFFLAASIHAQYAPPARDLQDVSRLTAEYQRLIKDAVAEPMRYAEGLGVLTSVHAALRDGPVLIALDNALNRIEDYEHRHERDDPPIPRDVQRFFKLVKTWIQDAKMGPPPADTLELRERIHHDVIHPMQRNLLAQVQQLQQVAMSFQQMVTGLDARITACVSTAAGASPEKP
jgi:hypothetical protein